MTSVFTVEPQTEPLKSLNTIECRVVNTYDGI